MLEKSCRADKSGGGESGMDAGSKRGGGGGAVVSIRWVGRGLKKEEGTEV